MTVEFYNNDVLEVIFDASRLVLDNTEQSQALSFDVSFPGAKQLFGLHHHATKIALPNTADGSMDPFKLKNSDTAGYEVGSPMALYGSKPILCGQSTTKTACAFIHNAAQAWVDIDYSTQDKPSGHFMLEGGSLDIFVLLGPTTKEVVRQITDLTGKAHLPQLWALGYHQSRYSYATQSEVLEVISRMDQEDFPMDAIWLDIDYTDGKRYFTWNRNNFPDPVQMQKTIASTNRKLVSIQDPHIKVDDNYAVYTGAKDRYFIKNPNGTDFQGDCWPGRSSYIDFLSDAGRDYWASWYAYDKFVGSTETLAGTWNDMNEPSVFNAYEDENSLPHDVLENGNVKHRDVMNLYGFLQSKASHQGLMQRDEGKKRPFVLSRSHFVGSQRYAAIWSGDNRAEWPYLTTSYSECMLSNLLGHVFCGADIGGFDWNTPDNLMLRWYQAAVWLPFFRSHSNNNVNRREPYMFYDEMKVVARKAMKTRYRYIPVFYTLFYLHTKYGDPVVRPLFYDYPERIDDDQYILVGSDILATPVFQVDFSSVDVHFPGDNNVRWYRADQDWAVYYGGDTREIFTIDQFFLIGTGTRYLNEESFGFFIHCSIPKTGLLNGHAEGLLYGDDFTSFEYSNNNKFYLLKFTYNDNNLKIEKIDGDLDYNGSFNNVVVHRASLSDPSEVVRTVHNSTIDGTPLKDLNFGLLFSNATSLTLNL
nr:neutral alpha-glucosidase C-like [Leptinotarsa decemlineata]